jgi:integrase
LGLERLFDAVEHGAVDKEGKRIGPPRSIQGLDATDRLMLYRVALGTGFRAGEIASLTPASFDLGAAPPTVTVAAGQSRARMGNRGNAKIGPEEVPRMPRKRPFGIGRHSLAERPGFEPGEQVLARSTV